MWRLLNLVFGWHYAVIENSYGHSVGRVRTTVDGFTIHYIGNGDYELKKVDDKLIADGFNVTPLTFSKKDIKEHEDD